MKLIDDMLEVGYWLYSSFLHFALWCIIISVIYILGSVL
jgi:hypothetical protein